MRIVVTALCILSASVVLAAAPAPSDPWAKVPKPPTACYTLEDPYYAELTAAIGAMNEQIARQKEINDRLKAQVDNLDPMEKQTRMQNFLMENPQEAARIMQAASAVGTSAEADINKASANEQRIQAELTAIQSRYDAALKTATGPLYANLKALGISESGTPQKTIDAGVVIVKKINAEYDRLCPQWWGASGPFNEWLKRYKEHLVQYDITNADGLATAQAVQFTMFGVPSDGYKSTVVMESVIKYMNQAWKVFDHRLLRPQENLVMP